MKLNYLFVLLALLLVFPASAQDELSIWVTGGENDATVLQEAAALFTEETGIEVSVSAVGWGEAYARYLTAVNSGEGADMFAGGMSWGISLDSLGGMVDLGEAIPDEIDSVLEVNNPNFVNAIIPLDGSVYGVPYNQDAHVMYYMVDALAEVGFEEPPATWDELTEAIEALNDAGLGGGGFGWGHASWLGFQPFLVQAGGSWYAEDCTAAAINSDEGMVALEFFTSLYDQLGFPQEQADTGGGFSTGELALTIDGEWTAPGINASYPELEGQWAIATLPEGPAGNSAAFLGGKMIGVFSYSENTEAAWEFIQWLQTSEAAEAMTEQAFNFGSLHLPPQPDNAEFIRGGEDISSVLAAQLLDTTAPSSCPGWEESGNDINIALQTVLFEEGDFEEALFEMEDILNANLEEYGG